MLWKAQHKDYVLSLGECGHIRANSPKFPGYRRNDGHQPRLSDRVNGSLRLFLCASPSAASEGVNVVSMPDRGRLTDWHAASAV